jgi:hypothetical protein
VAFPWDVTVTDLVSVGAESVGMSPRFKVGTGGSEIDPGGSSVDDVKSGGGDKVGE